MRIKGYTQGKNYIKVWTLGKLAALKKPWVLKLKNLDLNNLKLAEVPSNIDHLQQLERLNLSWNNLHSLPECIGNFPKLRILDISRMLWRSTEQYNGYGGYSDAECESTIAVPHDLDGRAGNDPRCGP